MKLFLLVLLAVLSPGCLFAPEPPTISLQSAVGSGDEGQVRANLYWCRKHGACSLDERNPDGETALHGAAVLGRTDIAGLLIDAGADVNSTAKDGATALHRAATFGNLAVAELLSGAGANLGVRTSSGFTAKQTAEIAARPGVASFLRAREAQTRSFWRWRGFFPAIALIVVTLTAVAVAARAVHRRRWKDLQNSQYAYAAYSVWRRDQAERTARSSSVRLRGTVVVREPDPDLEIESADGLAE